MKKIIYFFALLIGLLPTNLAMAITEPPSPVKTVYRFWSETYKGHFYTAEASEAVSVDANYPDYVWRSEGSVFQVYNPDICGGAPPGLCIAVHRFWSNQYRHHFYTISEVEKNHIIANMPEWQYEGVAYSADTVHYVTDIPLYRFWSDKYKGHFYTTSESERDNIAQNMPEWRYEGIAYYVIDPDLNFLN